MSPHDLYRLEQALDAVIDEYPWQEQPTITYDRYAADILAKARARLAAQKAGA